MLAVPRSTDPASGPSAISSDPTHTLLSLKGAPLRNDVNISALALT